MVSQVVKERLLTVLLVLVSAGGTVAVCSSVPVIARMTESGPASSAQPVHGVSSWADAPNTQPQAKPQARS